MGDFLQGENPLRDGGYPLVICYIAMENHNFNGRTHYVYGHVQWLCSKLPVDTTWQPRDSGHPLHISRQNSKQPWKRRRRTEMGHWTWSPSSGWSTTWAMSYRNRLVDSIWIYAYAYLLYIYIIYTFRIYTYDMYCIIYIYIYICLHMYMYTHTHIYILQLRTLAIHKLVSRWTKSTGWWKLCSRVVAPQRGDKRRRGWFDDFPMVMLRWNIIPRYPTLLCFTSILTHFFLAQIY